MVENVRSQPDAKRGAEYVTDELTEELTVHGNPRHCAGLLLGKGLRSKVKGVIAGFDMKQDKYSSEFFDSLEELSRHLGDIGSGQAFSDRLHAGEEQVQSL